ncbi:hypothetical protein PG997_007837 [Apiospora hydei]|uniref:Acid phosphatase-like protein n=1 Tax=Apiospora hydei TaxID=1337664 RepID=A0ABR1W957_9PEZI
MNSLGIFFLVLFLLLLAAVIGWVVFTQLRARRLGLPAPTLSSYNPFARSEPSAFGTPTPAPGGIRGWFNDKLRGRGNNRSAGGAYEQPSHGRGFGPLDPDEAWDSRVGHEADTYGPGGYYEEQELGHRNDPYTGSGYNMNLATTPGAAAPDNGRGRSRDRDSLGVPGAGGRSAANPFDDDAAEPSNMSMRGVSPRPIDTGATPRPGGGAAKNDSPTERRSVFRENV